MSFLPLLYPPRPMMKRTHTAALAAVLGMTLLLGACHDDRLPQGIMDTAAMTAFLTDAYQLEGIYAITSGHQYDTVSPEALRAYDDLLRKHGVSRVQVDSSLAYYATRPDVYADMLDKVVVGLGEEKEGSSDGEKPLNVSAKLE